MSMEVGVFMKECTLDVTFVPIRNPYTFKHILQSQMERATLVMYGTCVASQSIMFESCLLPNIEAM